MRLTLLVFTMIVYGFIFKTVHMSMGNGAFILMNAFPVAAGLIFGMRGGFLFGFITIFYIVFLGSTIHSDFKVFMLIVTVSGIVMLVLGSGVGRLRDLSLGLKKELQKREKVERRLKKSQNELELRVKERTLELEKATIELKKEVTERKRTEASLIVFRESLENSTDAIGMSTPDGRHYYQNKAFSDLFGEIGENPPETLYVDPRTGQEVFRAIMSGQRWIGEVQMYSKERQVLNIFLRAYANKDHEGNITSLVGIHSNITELKQVEQILHEKELTFRALFEKGPIGVAYHQMIYDKSGKPIDYLYLEANQSFQKLTGVNPVGKLVTQAFPGIEKDPFDWIGKYGEVAKTGREFRVQNYVQANDRWYDCVGYQYKPDHFVAAFLEITEQKQAEEALKEKTKFLDQIIETSALSMWISDEKGTAVRANPACLEFFGATQEEVVGKYNLFQDSVIENKGFMPVVREVFEKGKPASFVIDYDLGAVDHVEVKNATHKIIKTVLTPVLNNHKIVSNVIVQAIDLTEIKQSEEEKIRVNKILAEHEKLSLVGQVAGKMAHDFNNVLGIIMGNTELSLLDCKDTQIKKTLELIYEQTIRGKNLTKNLVAFSKDQEPKQEFFRIHEKIDLVINLLKRDLEGIDLIKEDKPGVPELLADPGMIEHALVNLIQNSIHATSKVEYPKIIMRTYCLENDICFEIEDNGCGIPEEYLENIFDPSFTLKGNKDLTGSYESSIRGTGYGMSNVKKYIELHMGTILTESKIGSGTKFTISLPIVKKELTNEEKSEIRKEIMFFEKYVLLVEDETAISDIQYNVLTQEPCNHKVDIAHNGKVAMDLFDRNEYDFISLDYVLPGKINGMGVYNYIRKKNQTIPILFISGNIEFLESIKNLKQKDKRLDHQSKPCQNKDYVKSINELLKRSNTG